MLDNSLLSVATDLAAIPAAVMPKGPSVVVHDAEIFSFVFYSDGLVVNVYGQARVSTSVQSAENHRLRSLWSCCGSEVWQILIDTAESQVTVVFYSSFIFGYRYEDQGFRTASCTSRWLQFQDEVIEYIPK